MNNDEIMRMAREAGWWQPLGLPSDWEEGDYVVSPEQMLRFAALVAAIRAGGGMSNYTDIVSDGGMDPRNAYDKVEVKPYDETPQAMKIRIQRLEKKVRKLKDQLQARNEKIEWLDGVLRYYPYAQRTHEEHMRQRANREELEMLRLRVEEQRLAIKQLNNELIEARIKEMP